MSVEIIYKKKNLESQQHVKKEIDLAQKGLSDKSYAQLRSILDELESMLNEKGLSVYYPRIIVDSWDFNDQLGLELLELEELYKRWK